MADKRYKDFDAAQKENESPKIAVKVNGETHEFPPALPARTVLAQMRWTDESGAMPTAAVPEWLASLVGDEVMEEILEKGATWNQLEELLEYLLVEYNVQDVNDTEEKAVEEGEDDSPK